MLFGHFNLRFLLFIFICFCNYITNATASRLKDIADIEGVRPNQLIGYGVVVGLNGTGDGNTVEFTNKSLSNMLENMGLRVNPEMIKVRNVASVLVTAELPPFVRPGSKIDITLSSLGDAKSLLGGSLLMTPLKGADGNVYAVAQGAVSVSGFTVQGEGDSAQKNHPTVGVISNGGIVEKALDFDLFAAQQLRIVLREPDFTTVNRLTKSINSYFSSNIAFPVDSASIEIPLTQEMLLEPVAFVAKLEQVQVSQDMGAKVVVNERSGTIVMGDNVRVSKVALAHGNLSITIRNDVQVSQPAPLANSGNTAIISNTEVQVAEEVKRLTEIGGEVTLGEVVSALNALGATPRDLITILVALKRAGALHAELEIM
jgi:flagellar P-ring protein FlgI